MENEMMKIYTQQLKFGCKRPSCSKIFCKATCEDSVVETVASILCLYSDDFVCENIFKTFVNNTGLPKHTDRGFWCTDMLYFYLELFHHRKSDMVLLQTFSESLSAATPYISEDSAFGNLSTRKIQSNRTKVLESKVKNINIALDYENIENSHKFCKFFNKENVTREEAVILTGVVGILLRKYDKFQNYSLGLLILRIINLLGDRINLNVQQFSIVSKIFFNIHLISIDLQNKSNPEANRNTIVKTGFEPSCYNCNYEEIQNNKLNTQEGVKRTRNISLESTSFTEDYEQYSILSERGTPNIMEADFTEAELGQSDITYPRSVSNSTIQPAHNVTISSDFDLAVSMQNNANDSPCLDIQNEADDSLLTEIKASQIQLDGKDKCFDREECYQNVVVMNNFKYTCLNVKVFSKNDLIKSVSAISSYLNSVLITDIRENKKIETALNVFHLLYLINEKMQVLSYKRFYLINFCAKINFREEFKFYRAKSKTPLNFSFILPVHIKAELIKAETNDMMKASLQDSFFRALFEGHIGPYLFITVSRENIYNESMEIIRGLNIEDVRKQLRITFKNEEGVDSGGIRKEYFQLLSHDVKHDERLFHIRDSSIWLRNDCLDLPAYVCIGRILGIALYNNVVLNIPFPSVFFKKLLNKKTTFYDLKEIDPELFMSLSNLKKLSSEEIDSLGLSFTINYISSKYKSKTYNLAEDKNERQVTKANVNSFINRYADFHINRLIHRQFEAIKQGFFFVIEKDTLLYLDHKELEKIIMGSNDFDIHALRSTASYSGYTPDSKIITWFWEILESYGKKMKRKLLQFITGNDRIPVAGPASLKLIIMKNGCDTDRLPSSQTCFNTLLLPEYSSKGKLESKLQTALEMTAGFYLL